MKVKLLMAQRDKVAWPLLKLLEAIEKVETTASNMAAHHVHLHQDPHLFRQIIAGNNGLFRGGDGLLAENVFAIFQRIADQRFVSVRRRSHEDG